MMGKEDACYILMAKKQKQNHNKTANKTPTEAGLKSEWLCKGFICLQRDIYLSVYVNIFLLMN